MLLVLSAPAAYLVEDAPQNYKDVITEYKKALDECLNGTRRALVLPSDTDENGNPFFKLEVYTDVPNQIVIKENE